MKALDPYARDARAWINDARHKHAASKILFQSDNMLVWLTAATVGHHALESYLKAALIGEGLTVTDNPALGVKKADRAWGHDLVVLGDQLAAKRPDFNLAAEFNLFTPTIEMPITVRNGFEIFDPFFSELRYPQRLDELVGVGQDHEKLLDALANTVSPFLKF